MVASGHGRKTIVEVVQDLSRKCPMTKRHATWETHPFRPLATACVTALALVTACAATATPALAKGNHCPPGLAKKSVPCVPPGQLGKSARHWSEGDHFDRDDAHWITRPDRYGLPPLPAGQRYVVMGNQIYVVNEATYQIVTALNIIGGLLD